MKSTKIFSLCAGVAMLVLAFAPRPALAEAVNSFDARIIVQPDATVSVTETIVYDFGSASRHGIYRDIPYEYAARGGNFSVRFSDVSVTDENGVPYRFTLSNSGSNKEIKIGDSASLVTGEHTYVIRYIVSRVVNYFSDHDELYWNVTGDQWPVAITDARAVVSVAGYDGAYRTDCFSGPSGSSASCTAQSAGAAGAEFRQQQLQPGNGFTVVVGFPKRLVRQPGLWEKFFMTLADNWGLGLPVVVFFAMFFLWYKKGRDPKTVTVVPQYEAPENVTPTEAGTIIDGTAGNQDVSAEIISLAANGYLKITRLQEKILGLFSSTDYQLEKLKDASGLPNEFEKIMFNGIFAAGDSVQLSSLQNSFYEVQKDVKDRVYQSVVDKGFFNRNPNVVRGWYFAGGILLAAGGVFLGIATQNVFTVIGCVVSGIIVAAFGWHMAHRTASGADMKAYILGLRLYLSVAEKDRLRFFNAPDKTPERFEKLLPYAMVLGVEKEWAGQFEGIYNRPPSWYSDPYGGNFSTLVFISSLNNFKSSANAAFVSGGHSSGGVGGGSGFGGGGFSGGGFGGGGGGSW